MKMCSKGERRLNKDNKLSYSPVSPSIPSTSLLLYDNMDKTKRLHCHSLCPGDSKHDIKLYEKKTQTLVH